MPQYATIKEGQNPAAWELRFQASNGFTLGPITYHNYQKAKERLNAEIVTAKNKNLPGCSGSITDLYKDKDSGLFLPIQDSFQVSAGYGPKK